jgi:hypothetical protein
MTRWPRLAALGCACATVSLCGTVGRAAGEEVSAQAWNDNGAWLPFAPAPAKPAGICLIDSGVNENPDTTAQLDGRTALDGGNPADVSPTAHGTLMAMEASAPPNGWGMIGAAPGAVRVLSVRAESTGDSLTFGAYKQAIVECQRLAERRPELDVKVISMSIGFQTAPSYEQLAQLEDAANSARTSGLDLVAAAGDEGAPALSYPAAVSPIVSVGAYGGGRVACPFSNGGGTGAAILAPGCGLIEASPVTGAPLKEYGGTSQATAIVAGVLGALRAYEPQLSPAAAEEALTTTARANGGLDVAASFRAAGLSYLVHAGELNEPGALAAAQQPTAEHPRLRDPAPPRVRLVRRRGQWVLRLLNLPRGASAAVRVTRLLRARAINSLRLLTRHPIIRFRARGPLTVTVSYRAGAQRSPATSIRRAR